jgi:hypothetical protein
MGDLTKDNSRLLDKLVSDCITFGLHLKEALGYIGKEYGSISKRTYFRRRTRLLSDNTRDSWYSYFTRIGFVELHKKQMDTIQMIQDDSLRRFYLEATKENRDENLILRLKNEIRETSKLLSEFSLGTPVVAGIKAKLEKANHGIDLDHNDL